MIKILTKNQSMMSVIALLLRSNENRSNSIDKLLMTIYSGALISLIISSGIYFLKNIQTFIQCIEAFYIICIFSMFLGVYLYFAVRKTNIRDLLNAMQIIVERSE